MKTPFSQCKMLLFIVNIAFIIFLAIQKELSLLSSAYTEDSILVSNRYCLLSISLFLFFIDFVLKQLPISRLFYFFRKKLILKQNFFREEDITFLLIAKYRSDAYSDLFYFLSFMFFFISWIFLIVLSAFENQNFIDYSVLYILFAYPVLYLLLYYISSCYVIKISSQISLNSAFSLSIINSSELIEQEMHDYEIERNEIVSKRITNERKSLSKKISIDKNSQYSGKKNSRL